MPYNNDDMVECTACLNWYHVKCEDVPVKVMNSKNAKWHCSICNCSS